MRGDKTALVGHVGRNGVSFALTDPSGGFREETIRGYEAARHRTISAALMAFKEESGLTSLPRRCVLAVAGMPRGDTISVTSSRWFISKAGLTAILQHPPMVLNDFAAKVWAVSTGDQGDVVPAGDRAPSTGPGTFAVVGMGDGLGVAAFLRDESGQITIIPTEAGHSELLDPSPEVAPIIEGLRKENRFCSAESLLSSGGLVAICRMLRNSQGGERRADTADDVIEQAASGDDQAARACTLFARALWRFAGNIALIYGAWDGIFFTGRTIRALRETFATSDVRHSFFVAGPYANLLQSVPTGIVLIDHSTMRGAAEAMRRLG